MASLKVLPAFLAAFKAADKSYNGDDIAVSHIAYEAAFDAAQEALGEDFLTAGPFAQKVANVAFKFADSVADASVKLFDAAPKPLFNLTLALSGKGIVFGLAVQAVKAAILPRRLLRKPPRNVPRGLSSFHGVTLTQGAQMKARVKREKRQARKGRRCSERLGRLLSQPLIYNMVAINHNQRALIEMLGGALSGVKADHDLPPEEAPSSNPQREQQAKE